MLDNGDFDEKLKEFLDKGLPEALVKGMEKACIIAQDEGKILCPVDTGRLRASIDHEVTEEGGKVVGYVGSNVEYAPYVEAKKGFLEQAVNASRSDILDCFKGLI